MKLERMMIDGVEYELTPVQKVEDQPTTEKKTYSIPDGIQFEVLDYGETELGLWFGEYQCLWFMDDKWWKVGERNLEPNPCHLEEVAFEDLKVGDWFVSAEGNLCIANFNLIIETSEDQIQVVYVTTIGEIKKTTYCNDTIFYRVTVS